MKTATISALIVFYACMNQVETKSADHIVLPTIEPTEEVKLDTFIAVTSNELQVEEAPKVASETKTPANSQKENAVKDDIKELIKAPTISTKQETISLKQETEATEVDHKTSVLAEEKIKIKVSDIPVGSESPLVNNGKIETSNTNTTTDVQSQVQEAPKEEVIVKEEVKEPVVENVPAKANHAAFAALLKSFVSNSGDVNYKGFKSSESKLDAYLSELDKNSPQGGWSKNEQLAYWMNAYNAFTIKLILDNYPVSKITDLHGGKPWDVSWIKLGGKTYSLNNIEHDIIRPTFNDPRIHFAVNCAAKSCPPLLNQAYTGDNVNRLLNKVTKAFVNSSSNQISPNAVRLSKIFEWYAVDFGNIVNFLNQYSSKKIDSDAKIGYLDYNWSLNEG